MKEKGNKAEISVLRELVMNDFTVLEPYGDNEPYDIVVELDSEFRKLQVKSSRFKKGSIIVSLKRTNMTSDGAQNKYYTADEIDAYAVYSPEFDVNYYVPFEEAPKSQMRLRVNPVDPQHRSNDIRWAEDHELENFI